MNPYPGEHFDRLERVIMGATSRAASERDLLVESMRPNRALYPPSPLDPDALYCEIALGRSGPLSALLDEHFTVLARPGEFPWASPQAGDVVVRVGLPGLGHVAVLEDATLWPAERLAGAPFRSESQRPGFYALVIEAGAFPHTRSDPFARRVLDAAGRMPPGQLLLRPNASDYSPSGIGRGDEEMGVDPEQIIKDLTLRLEEDELAPQSDQEEVEEHEIDEGGLFEAEAPKISLADLRKRIDEYFGLANTEYDLRDGTKVRARPQFHYAKEGDPETAIMRVKSILGEAFEKRYPRAIRNAAYGRAKPSEVAAITQGLIDAGELGAVRAANRHLHDDQLVRALQRKFKIGIDCAGYVQLAFIYAFTGSDDDPPKVRKNLGLHERRGLEKLASLPRTHFTKVNVVDGRTGDLFVMKPRADSPDRAWHTVIIVDHTVSGSQHTFLADASWGTDLYGETAGGIARRKLVHDTSTGKWWDIHPINGTKACENAIGPYNEHPVHGMYRAKNRLFDDNIDGEIYIDEDDTESEGPLTLSELIEEGSFQTEERESTMEGIKLGKSDQPLYYVGIDVTGAIDTVAWGHLWNAKFGWRNLLWELAKDPTDNQRRIDKDHPKLPIARLKYKYNGMTYRDTCIMPQGIDAKGTDKLWSGPNAIANMVDINAGCTFMQTFLLSPAVDKARSSLNDNRRGKVADVIYISSHGFSTGDMFGDISSAEPIFTLASTANSGAQFSGVGWLLLSNCSTLKPSTHNDWLKLMTGLTPLRGIVGFQDTCPLPKGSVKVFTRFINRLAKGKTFITAWAEALKVSGIEDHWIVLCHESAVGDTIADYNARVLKAIPLDSKVFMFNKSNPAGVEVVPQHDPFEVFWSKGGRRITAVNRIDPANKLSVGDTVAITVMPPPPEKTFNAGTTISITLVYVRANHPQNTDITKIFTVTGQSGVSAFTVEDLNPDNPAGPDSWQLTVKDTPTEVKLILKCKDLTGLHSNYTFWLRVGISTMRHDFVRNGSILVK